MRVSFEEPLDTLFEQERRHEDLGSAAQEITAGRTGNIADSATIPSVVKMYVGEAHRTSDPFRKEMFFAAQPVWAFAFSLCRNHARADDILQETLTKAWNSRDTYLGTGMRHWLFKIAQNHYRSEQRRAWRSEEDINERRANALAVEPEQIDGLHLANVRAAIEYLSPERRKAFELIVEQGLTYDIAGEILGCPPGTIKSRVSRARDFILSELNWGDDLEPVDFRPAKRKAVLAKTL